VIELREVLVEHDGRPALGPLSGTFGEGQLVVAGPAQCGKTTLLKALCGLLLPTRGSVLVDGCDLNLVSSQERAQIRERFGMVFQSDALFDSMDALGNVALPLTRRGLARPAAQERAREALKQVGLGDHAQALPERLSGGMRKRLGIARAIVARPHYLLADDPVAGLDPGTTEHVLDLLFSLWKGKGGLILASADPAGLLARCDDLLVLDAGLPVARGAPQALRAAGTLGALAGEAIA